MLLLLSGFSHGSIEGPMTLPAAQSTDASSSNAETGKVLVWDVWVRVFHWSFAVLIAMAWLTHRWEGAARGWHQWLGYGAVTLVGLRIVWGLVGSRYARFSEFVPGPKRLAGYVGDMLSGRERRFIGHNPAGALMVLLLMGLSIGLAVTGFVMTHRGMTLFGLGRRPVHEMHDIFGNLYIIAVPVHVLGVIFESIKHRENLVAAMITGRKRSGD